MAGELTDTAPPIEGSNAPVSQTEREGRRFVALCDVLGFRELLKSKALAEIAEDYRGLIARLKYDTSLVVTRLVPGKEEWKENLRFDSIVFSDSLVIISPVIADDEDQFHVSGLFLSSISRLIPQAYVRGLPIRVGIAFGNCVYDKEESIAIGQPFVDAYETESRQEWMGAACHPSCFDAPMADDTFSLSVTHRAYGGGIEFPVPAKERPGAPPLGWTVDWPYFIPKKLSSADMDLVLAQDATKYEGTPHAGKWANTLAFYRSRRHEHEAGSLSLGGLFEALGSNFAAMPDEEKRQFLDTVANLRQAFKQD